MIDKAYINELLTKAYKEDMPYGDITTDNVFTEDDKTNAYIVAKEDGVICGSDIAIEAFKYFDSELMFTKHYSDGEEVKRGSVILEISGKTKALFKAERTALNIFQRLSGIATITSEYVKEVSDYNVSIVDTRKTTPLLRRIEKYAVTVGGGTNHRFSLSDAVMLKDNHIDAMGGIEKAVSIIRKKIPHTIKIEVEVRNIKQVKEALKAKVDIIMLDNMDDNTMKEACEIIDKRAIVEASGNVSIERLKDIAKTGVDIISIGKLTHSVKAMDISMKVEKGFK